MARLLWRRPAGRQSLLRLRGCARRHHRKTEVVFPVHPARHARLGCQRDRRSCSNQEFGGKPRKLLVQANRNGFYYVLDRTNGEFLLARRLSTSSIGRTASMPRGGQSKFRTWSRTRAASRSARRCAAPRTGCRRLTIPQQPAICRDARAVRYLSQLREVAEAAKRISWHGRRADPR